MYIHSHIAIIPIYMYMLSYLYLASLQGRMIQLGQEIRIARKLEQSEIVKALAIVCIHPNQRVDISSKGNFIG